MEVVYLVFLLSGTIKASLPLIGLSFLPDLTMMSTIIIFFFLIKTIIREDKKLNQLDFYYILLLFIFYGFMIASLLYTSSELYGYIKTIYFLTMILAFIFPIFLYKKININKFMFWFSLVVFVLTIIFFNFYSAYLSGSLKIDLSKEQILSMTGLYLTLSELLAIIAIYYYFSDKKNYLFIFLALLLMIATGGRGPLLSTFLIIFMNLIYKLFKLFLKFKIKKTSIISFVSIGIFILLLTVLLQYDKTNDYSKILNTLIEHSLERFSVLFESHNGGDSINNRMKYIKFTLEHIDKNPLFGYGIGSFGKEYTGVDHRAYPHNIFLETWFELGIIPTIVLVAFFIFILYKSIKNKCSFCIALYFLLLLSVLKSSSLVDIRILMGFLGMFIGSQKLKNSRRNNNAN